MENVIDALEFTPINRYMSFGNEIQIAETEYKGIKIIERTFFPWNIFKDVSVIYSVCLLLPIKPIMNGIIDGEGCYCAEGFGTPDFKELGFAIEFIDNYKV
jgi:hypothetical protein